MPKLIRLYMTSVLVGFWVAATFTGLLIWQDVGGIGRLILGSDIGWIAGLMMVVFNGLVFSAVQFGVAIMRMADEDGPRGGHLDRDLVPVRVTEQRRRAPRPPH